MDKWDNYIMRKYGKGIRAEIFRAYERSFARAKIISNIHDHLLDKMISEIPEDKWVKAG